MSNEQNTAPVPNQECDADIYKYGEHCGLVEDTSKLDEQCRTLNNDPKSQYRYDWHYTMGRGAIKRLPKNWTRPAEWRPIKDHEIARLVSGVTRIGEVYAGSQQLREMMSQYLADVLKTMAVNGEADVVTVPAENEVLQRVEEIATVPKKPMWSTGERITGGQIDVSPQSKFAGISFVGVEFRISGNLEDYDGPVFVSCSLDYCKGLPSWFGRLIQSSYVEMYQGDLETDQSKFDKTSNNRIVYVPRSGTESKISGISPSELNDATKIQMAGVMLQSGTPEQQVEATEFLGTLPK